MLTSGVHNNHDVLLQLKKGSETAFISIYEKYWSKLYVIAYNRLNSKQAAEDVVQEVMTSLWERKDELTVNNLDAWLSAATRYSVFRQLAKYGSQKIVSIVPASQPGMTYEQPFDFGFLKTMLQEEIHQLPEKCRLVFEYSRNHGLSNKEIAGELEISEKAVEKHITKAIAKLRLKLKAAFVFFSPFLCLLFY